MKILLAISLLASKAFASILPGNAAIVVRNEEGIGEVVELEVTNGLFPGKVFKGTAESIYAEMNALNPDGLAQQNAELKRRDNLALSNDDDNSEGLEKRQGTFNCSWGHEILNWMKCFDALAYLQNLGTSMCMVGGGHGTIVRVACSRGCSMYLSNKVGDYLNCLPDRSACMANKLTRSLSFFSLTISLEFTAATLPKILVKSTRIVLLLLASGSMAPGTSTPTTLALAKRAAKPFFD
ncbi:hypothetical protein NM208_g1197 [Fusarium decemcellulare]|uniref:Uncharacterized protein n=1 Tax=Fusarium decemcellulare TaxID=57161 RepID=A0ACC1SX11_9HYPO|nr:hypothetical protein NM208_g1197 [Fusarium decemcellulare]